nr:MAG TPA: hypothetical protein [Caudoviricetes sp.]
MISHFFTAPVHFLFSAGVLETLESAILSATW